MSIILTFLMHNVNKERMSVNLMCGVKLLEMIIYEIFTCFVTKLTNKLFIRVSLKGKINTKLKLVTHGKKLKFVKLKLFQVCGLKSLKVNKLTLKLKLMTKKFIDSIKIVDNSYSDEEGKKS